MLKAILLSLIAPLLMRVPAAPAEHNYYTVCNDSGLHLFMDDNGTPDNYEDDFVIDWEDNREIVVTFLD